MQLSPKNKFLLALVIIISICFVILFIIQKNNPLEESLAYQYYNSLDEKNNYLIKINQSEVEVEIAKSLAKQMNGLSGRDGLAEGRGMLFVYNKYFKPSFWMSKMKFSIDIIWIKDNLVVDLTESLEPPTDGYFPQEKPNKNVNMVLEINPGFIEKNGVKIGDSFELLTEVKE